MNYLLRLIHKTYQMAMPHDRKVVLDNFAALSALQAIMYMLPVIIIPYLFRAIGPSKFGLIAFAQAFVQYFMIITDYGFGISATKEISLSQDEPAKVSEIFSAVMTAKIALAGLSLLILGSIVYFIPRFRQDWMVYLLSFGTVVGNTLFPVWFFQGTEKMRYIASLNSLGSFLFAVLIFLLVKTPADYLLVPLISSCVFMIIGLLGQYIVFRKFGILFRFPGYSNLQKQLKAGWDIFISMVAINAYTSTRVFTVGLLTNNALTGFYSMAEKAANAFQTFPLSSFSQALFPRLSKIFQKNRAKAFELMQRIQLITTLISLVFLSLAFVFSDLIVQVACGGDFRETTLSLRILLIGVFFVSANAFRVQFLLVCGKTDIYSHIHVIMAMLGMPLIFLLIYSFSYVGAAIATAIIEAGIFIITYFTVRKLRFD